MGEVRVRSGFRSQLEAPELAAICWINFGLGHPAFDGNPEALNAIEQTVRRNGANNYVTEPPESVLDSATEFLSGVFKVNLARNQIAVTTSGTRCIPAYITMRFAAENGRPMVWLVEMPGYPGHEHVIELVGGVCIRRGQPGCEFLDLVEEMEESGELERFDGIIFQAVVNPTAKVMTPEMVSRITCLAARSGKLVLFDGAYQCVTAGEPVQSPLLGADNKHSNVLWTYSLSKGDQLANLGYGLALGDPKWVARFSLVQSVMREGGNLASFNALEACMRNPGFLKKTSQGYCNLAGNFETTMGEAGVPVPQWAGSIFEYFPMAKGWVEAGKTPFDFAMEFARRGVRFYSGEMFNDEEPFLRARLSRKLEDPRIRTRLAETAADVVNMYR